MSPHGTKPQRPDIQTHSTSLLLLLALPTLKPNNIQTTSHQKRYLLIQKCLHLSSNGTAASNDKTCSTRDSSIYNNNNNSSWLAS